jgi:hypothetical protein
LAQREAVVSALLPLTSTETRRSVIARDGYSALDCLFWYSNPPSPWKIPAIEELLTSRVPVRRDTKSRALPFAARLAERRWAEAAARARSAGTTWREHERMVKLAFDFQDMRAAEEGVRVREARVEELEEELRRRGIEEDSEGGSA